MAEQKTEKINVWLTPEQVAWLKTKKNVSQTVRAMVTEAMSIDALAASVKKKAAPAKAASSKAAPSKPAKLTLVKPAPAAKAAAPKKKK